MKAFYEKYFPESLRDKKEGEFLTLEQGSTTMDKYEAKFTELSRFAPHMVADAVMKAKKFERRLNYDILRDSLP